MNIAIKTIIVAIVFTILYSSNAYAGIWEYSEESKRLVREAGLQMEELEWEEIDRRQQEYWRRKTAHRLMTSYISKATARPADPWR